MQHHLFKAVFLLLAVLAIQTLSAIGQTHNHQVHILLITADDMNWNTPACFGGTAPDITPNIDRLAREGMRFMHAHITIAVCTPSRSVLLTGRYPHRNGVEGFQRIRENVPTLPELLHKAGYLCGIIGKPLGQQEKFKWSMRYIYQGKGDEDMWGRDPNIYYRFTRNFLQKAVASNSPFFLMANSHDPHRPFHGSEEAKKRFGQGPREIVRPSRIYGPHEIEVPGFLPDLPDIRQEIAQYYSSVRRCDDTVGMILRALRQSGLEKNTLVIFLSDNGISFPFAKTNCYLNSTRTPWIVRWPRKVKPNTIDNQHMISGIDFMSTILDAVGLAHPKGMDGFSFLPILRGEQQKGREMVFTQFHHIHGRRPYPMRCVQTMKFGYIFNPWANGERSYDAEPLSGLTFKAMTQYAATDPQIAERVKMLRYRTVEEFYDLQKDPDALHNLIEDPTYNNEIDQLRKELLDWMKRTVDPALNAFKNRHSPETLEKFMQDYKAKAAREIEELKAYEIETGYRF
ncbi:MAG: sulfatase family protein [Planctomycetota bacterium]|jgi:N-sulfoglucosamine sulfohydrolase